MTQTPTPPASDACELQASPAALVAVSAVFDSLGRGVLCLDTTFRVLHVSPAVAQLVGLPASALVGQCAEQLLGPDLFAAGAPLRASLEAGERREGWRATLLCADGSRLVSLTAAPFVPDAGGVCDPTVAFLVVIRPAEEDETAGSAAPTQFGNLVARSAAMHRIFQLVANLQGSEATVLLSGESGTGKEVLARAIHRHSLRRNGPFVAVNCAGLPGELLESELFGHVRGAFTGAVRDRAGRFEVAQGGTLFLDEIGDLPLHLQGKLLRVLQERTFERVGESHGRPTDARVIAATNVDLRRAVADGELREDLFYRLRVLPIDIPPLRERREDIEPLARLLLARVGSRQGREVRFSPATLRALLGYRWPGNVRELENALEYAVAVCRGQTLQPEDLPAEVTSEAPQPLRSPADDGGGTAGQLRAALEAHRWNREATARALGISRSTLWRRMREHGLAGA